MNDRHQMKFLTFTREGTTPTGKTTLWNVTNKESVRLGRIKWNGAWRKYVFHPTAGTHYDTRCMTDLASFLKHLDKMHRRGLA